MKITIARKLAPFSHTPGTSCVIPGTTSLIQAFPSLLRFHNFEYSIPLQGGSVEFTLQQDLEKNCIFIFGKDREKFYRFRLRAFDEGFELFSEKTKEKKIFAAQVSFYLPSQVERLSLGSHRGQDWDLVMRRFDLREILPTLFSLGQKLPLIPPQPLCGTAHLLSEERLEGFCKMAFSSLLVPHLKDEKYLGSLPDESIQGDPFFLLQEGAKLIRSLFFRQNERRLEFLPSLLFDAGRLIHLQAPGVGEIDLEWASKKVRRIIIRASQSGEVILSFFDRVKGYRLRKNEQPKGVKRSPLDPLLLENGKIYFLDNFIY